MIMPVYTISRPLRIPLRFELVAFVYWMPAAFGRTQSYAGRIHWLLFPQGGLKIRY